MALAINEDTTFLIADPVGDIPPGSEFGLYQQDIRYLSRYELRLAGQRPIVLTARTMSHLQAVHILLIPRLGELPHGSLTLERRRTMGSGLHEWIELSSYVDQFLTFRLELRLDADFAHIFEVRGGVDRGPGSPDRVLAEASVPPTDPSRLLLASPRQDRRLATEVRFSAPPDPDGSPHRPSFTLHLPARGKARLELEVVPLPSGEPGPVFRHGFDRELAILHAEEAFIARAPKLETDSYPLAEAYRRAIRDLAALRIEAAEVAEQEFALAAGVPWFMAVFGRDSLLTGYQLLPYLPEVASGSLRVLARLQGTRVNAETEEEPGKILHEHRAGAGPGHEVLIPGFPYYGTIDATPLFLILLAEAYLWTGDLALVRELWPAARAALEWLDRAVGRDPAGYLAYERHGPRGLANQGWKDSWDSIRFQDGRVAEPPIALCEVQGYAYAARMSMAGLAEALGEPALAAQQREIAGRLRQRFDRDFWLPKRGTFALALDGQRRPVDGLASNAGHCLWTGIAEPDKAAAVVERLLGPELFSGWGVRTMGSAEGGYNPIGYHTGSVWPHDTALIADGLVRYGHRERAARLVEGLLAAVERFEQFRLPELFAGHQRGEYGFPVEYPTPCKPQAWAAGTVPLLLTCMLGLRADVPRRRITVRPSLPGTVSHVGLTGLRIGDDTLDLEIRRVDGEVRTVLRRVPRGFKVEGTVFRWSIFW